MKISEQMKRRSENNSKLVRNKSKKDGNTDIMVSTGSTLLDLAISGGRVRGGGIPGGILVEIFGPSGAGKTVLLCEIAGAIKRLGGAVMFKDPEARLNRQFAQIFDLNVDHIDYSTPDTVTEVFSSVRSWEPGKAKINGIFADSMAALSTDMEMEKEEGDKMGMRRAKEFSEELRKTCRILTKRNFLMVVSNQIRQNLDAGNYGPKFKSPGGQALPFYSSLRLRMMSTEKEKRKIKVKGKEITRVVGVTTEIEVFKSSVWAPYRTAPVTILFDYGIDDIRQNLQFIKSITGSTVYTIGTDVLDKSIEKSIATIEEAGLESQLREEVIDYWEELEEKFKITRKHKDR